MTNEGIKFLVQEIADSYARVDAIIEKYELTEQDHSIAMGMVFEQWGLDEGRFDAATESIREQFPWTMRNVKGNG